MPRYIRYGYVIHEIFKYQGQIETAANVAFHLNPKLARENVDSIIDAYNNEIREFDSLQTVEDTTFKSGSSLVDQVIRHVLIKYLDGSTIEITVERWGVKVGKE
jgi:hypothetical protein